MNHWRDTLVEDVRHVIRTQLLDAAAQALLSLTCRAERALASPAALAWRGTFDELWGHHKRTLLLKCPRHLNECDYHMLIDADDAVELLIASDWLIEAEDDYLRVIFHTAVGTGALRCWRYLWARAGPHVLASRYGTTPATLLARAGDGGHAAMVHELLTHFEASWTDAMLVDALAVLDASVAETRATDRFSANICAQRGIAPLQPSAASMDWRHRRAECMDLIRLYRRQLVD